MHKKTCLEGLITLCAYIRNEERSKISNLCFHFSKIKDNLNSKLEEEIIKFQTKIKAIENEKSIKLMKLEAGF